MNTLLIGLTIGAVGVGLIRRATAPDAGNLASHPPGHLEAAAHDTVDIASR